MSGSALGHRLYSPPGDPWPRWPVDVELRKEHSSAKSLFEQRGGITRKIVPTLRAEELQRLPSATKSSRPAPPQQPMSTSSPHPDLVKVTELFLVPSSFLVAALGTADTNLHRAAVSLLGLVANIFWMVAVRDAYRSLTAEGAKADDIPVRTRILCWLPLAFCLGWVVSLIVHLFLWNKPLAKY